MALNWDFIGILVGNLFTLCAWSMLAGDNPVAKFTEHLYIGVLSGYFLVVNLFFIYQSGLLKIVGGAGLTPEPRYIIGIILTLMLFFRLSRNTVWAYRYPMAVLLACGLASSMRVTIFSQFLDQIRGCLPPVNPLIGVPAGTAINNLIMIVGTLTSAIYFIFSREFRGPMKNVHKLGRYFLLIAFGGTYGATVVFRYELIAGRMVYLLTPDVIMYSLGCAIVVLAILVICFKTGISEWKAE